MPTDPDPEAPGLAARIAARRADPEFTDRLRETIEQNRRALDRLGDDNTASTFEVYVPPFAFDPAAKPVVVTYETADVTGPCAACIGIPGSEHGDVAVRKQHGAGNE